MLRTASWVALAGGSVAVARSRSARRRRRKIRCSKAEEKHILTAAVVPPAHDLTIIVTTSPIRSNPSTAMIEDCVRAFSLADGLQSCHKIIVCDGCNVTNGKNQFKKGKVTADDASRYGAFVAALTNLAETHALPNTSVLPLLRRSGFAQAIKTALEHVKTTFVMVVQHDQHIMRNFNVASGLQALRNYPDQVKYLGLLSNSTINYAPTVRSKFKVIVKPTNEFGPCLMPLIFFYDKPHICSASFYRSFVFGPVITLYSCVTRSEWEYIMGK